MSLIVLVQSFVTLFAVNEQCNLSNLALCFCTEKRFQQTLGLKVHVNVMNSKIR